MKNNFNINELNIDVEEDTLKDKYLTFFICNQMFGIAVKDVVQIVGIQEITSIPEFPDYAKGIINLRGAIIPIIDVRLRLHKEEVAYNDKTCIIVTKIQDSLIGYIVDAVNEVTNIEKANISEPPKMGTTYVNKFLIGVAKINDKITLLLDTQKMLSEEELELVSNI
ncbi:MAG: CheW protein [Bacillota bacterium]|jgi:purine-binding chemotaxis protein CheW|nr:CheW protein [Bacillota bacterium]